jgi:hypothetical protein
MGGTARALGLDPAAPLSIRPLFIPAVATRVRKKTAGRKEKRRKRRYKKKRKKGKICKHGNF